LKRKDRRGEIFRCFFATDIHGSERCFRKFLAAARVYDADALILGGDIAGKAIVPMKRTADGRIALSYDDKSMVLSEDEAEPTLARMKDAGLYPRFCEEEEFARLGAEEQYRESVFDEVIREQAAGWCVLAAERLADSVRLVITPGNDDPFVIDEVLRQAQNVECPERELLQLGPITLASLGNTNHTPWHTPREYTEEQLTEQIEQMLAPAQPGAKLVFNFHCPPKGSGLDTAAKLDETLKPVVVGGHAEQIAAGSEAVLQAIDRHAPVVGLHGHIHESAGAWRRNGTVCLNPGSEYGSGTLKGALVLFDASGDYKTHVLTTG
jgi:Icc-related predicted phosphoesterase